MTTDVDVAVIGGGLAGLTAAAKLAAAGRSVAAFTGPVAGGLLLSIESIEGMPEHPEGVPGYDLCPMTLEAAMDAGAQVFSEDANAIAHEGERWQVRGDAESVRARALVLAPGSRLRTLDVPGEARLEGKGVSQCASCDAPLLRGKPVAVVGGGDAACQEALTLAMHASQVHLLVRGDAMRAAPGWQQRVREQPKIVPHHGVTVVEIEGDTGVQAVRLADGTRLSVDGVFVYAGLLPNTDFLGGLVELDPHGRIVVDDALCASRTGLAAAGSARSGSSGQAAQAAADGERAAATIDAWLSGSAWPPA